MTFPRLQLLKAKSDMAAMAMRASLLSLRLKAGFNPNQPRVPAGNPEGGQWTDSGAGRTGRSDDAGGGQTPVMARRVVRDLTGEKPWAAYEERRRSDGTRVSTTVYNRDGSHIVSESPVRGTERNVVTLPDGQRVVFENDSDTQRIYDADGRLISEAVWTPNGPIAEPIVQPVLFDSRKPGTRPRLLETPAEVALDAGIELYNWWLSTQEPGEEVVFSFRADKLEPVPGEPPLWTSKIKREEVEENCPRFPFVQSMTNQIANSFNPTAFKNKGAYGTAVHMGVKSKVDALHDSNLTTEVSIFKSNLDQSRYALKGTVRIDIIERRVDDFVCVYDLKTGAYPMPKKRFLEIYFNVMAKYPQAKGVIIIEVRPEK